VILSTCGLFLLLAAPFLMAATIIIYAGAIIVTFLFVLMLSAANGRTDENERSREPLLGTLAGFAFTGLILFTLHQSELSTATAATTDAKAWNQTVPLPTPTITLEERNSLGLAADELKKLEEPDFYPPTERSREERTAIITHIEELLDVVLGYLSAKTENSTQFGSIHARLARFRTDRQADSVLKQAEAIRIEGTRILAKVETAINDPARARPEEARADVRKLRQSVLILAGSGELPARNTANLGYLLYSEHLLAIELAGTLLLVAAIGAIAIAHRKGAAA
jgi:NADH:ubiquinone oxidoreductase subunit 6 (subunit J)